MLDQQVRELREEQQIPGLAAGLVHRGVLVATRGWGKRALGSGAVPDEHTPFRIASMTKSFTASAVLLLRDRGLLRLDDEIREHLPWFRQEVAGPRVCVRDLLTMNAGLPTDDPWGDRQEDLPYAQFEKLVANGLSFLRPPRIGFEYSNTGYAVLGRLITAASGVDYREFVSRELLNPLGMTSTGFDEPGAPGRAVGYVEWPDGLHEVPATDSGSYSAMGGLLSTVSDLARWVSGFWRTWHDDVADDTHPLDRWSRREMQEPHCWAHVGTATDDSGTHAVSSAYGYGLWREDHSRLGRFLFHSGGYPGFGSHMRWHPASGWGVIVLGNRTYAHARRAAERALAEIVSDEAVHLPVRPWAATLTAMDAVDRLLTHWDDATVDALFSMNMDLDLPRPMRRDHLLAVGARVGAPITRDHESVKHDSPAHARWRVSGPTGSATISILLDPQSPPRVQAITTVT